MWTTGKATIDAHKCTKKVPMPEEVAALVVCKDSRSCLLCGTLCGKQHHGAHQCSISRLSPIIVDAFGVTLLPDPVNVGKHPSRHLCAEYTGLVQASREHGPVWALLVLLPGEQPRDMTITVLVLEPSDMRDASEYRKVVPVATYGNSKRAKRSCASMPPALGHFEAVPAAQREAATNHTVRVLLGRRAGVGAISKAGPGPAGGAAAGGGGATGEGDEQAAGGSDPGVAGGEGGEQAAGGANKSAAGQGWCRSGVAGEAGRLVEYVHVFYFGQVIDIKDKDGASLSQMDCEFNKLRTLVEPLRYGSTGYKLNHSCAAKLVSQGVVVPRWQQVASVLLPKKRKTTFEPMEELFWDYKAECGTPGEELMCMCKARGKCTGLLVWFVGRGDDQLPEMLDPQTGKLVAVPWAHPPEKKKKEDGGKEGAKGESSSSEEEGEEGVRVA
ncbi:hypothetical protein CHLRE_16g681051v5 [Chlamydomonas reinhardtii]|uniref:Uncharacterized protein n=1 Tax=Chlamydomonas reinhardtii TaxID=3055 RepID=A0A2K3CV33_CHLRE|nr:uncharacterized protein CHLRE_16g681051v5 [Chlamydomonas reinhardtii]PNW72136.1 hypothetical protein CHLRE_16g681051v5 [Chlamydomonas reinhardtii]